LSFEISSIFYRLGGVSKDGIHFRNDRTELSTRNNLIGYFSPFLGRLGTL
jgi:hypothetical protein